MTSIGSWSRRASSAVRSGAASMCAAIRTSPSGSLPSIRRPRNATMSPGTPAAIASGSRCDRQSSAIPARSASLSGRSRPPLLATAAGDVAVAGDAEGGEHRAQVSRPGAGQRARAGAHQRERGQLGAGRGQHGLAADQPAVGVPDQVSRAGRVHDREDVRAEGGRRVAARLVGPRGLELAAHVDRDHVPAVVGQQVQDGEEVFLAAGVAGDEQGGVPLAHPRRGRRLQGRERPAGGADGGTPNPVRQLEGGGSAHSGEPYLATLNRTSASAQRKTRNPGQEALRRVSSD